MSDPIAEIRRQNLGVYEASPGRLREDVSQEAQVAHDYRGRLAYELLQNADDAMEDNQDRHNGVAFHVTDDALWVANTGRPLSVADIQGLCGLGASSKVDAHGTKRASIGHKGLGFKSVLEITDTPMGLSTTYSFELGEHHARTAVRELLRDDEVPNRLPVMRFPVEVSDLPHQWRTFRDNGYNTAFYFPFSDRIDAFARHRLADLLLDLPITTVVFLKHLEEVSVTVDQGERTGNRTWRATRSLRHRGSWAPVDGLRSSGLFHITVEGTDQPEVRFLLAHEDEVSIGDYRDGLSGPAWEGVQLSEVSVAVLDPERHEEAMPNDWRRFHVFLPTAERCPYPILVNGAFTTDLSRQRVRVDRRERDYNAQLVREAARLFRSRVAPVLIDRGPDRLLAALDRGEQADDPGSAASMFHIALVQELSDLAFVPSGDQRRTLATSLAPPVEVGDAGPTFSALLDPSASFEGRGLPDPRLCTGPLGRIAADHGARRMTAAEAATMLAESADPASSRLIDHETGGFAVDPVVDLLSLMWTNADPQVRDELENAVRQLPLFPGHVEADRSVTRIALGDQSAFYPPQSARQDLPLTGLAFMLHEVCWGALLPNERKSLLGENLTVWHALFDVSEFRFEEVMRASVLPGLVLNPERDARLLRDGLEDVETLAAICQLAGKQPKPDRPLRYQRLQSDRALFNLSRLPVPCQDPTGGLSWIPAYRAYFGREWIGDDSVEALIEAAQDGGLDVSVPILAPPEIFLGLLGDLVHFSPDAGSDEDAEGDEVGLDEDLDQPLETDERARWMAFLGWIGVNPCLRPVHFHDVEDRDSWLTTKELAQPKGWAFEYLSETWQAYRQGLVARLEEAPSAASSVPYLYECHDLEALALLIDGAERDASGTLARALFSHLTRHWETYSGFEQVQLALVAREKSPSQRSKPQRALPEERHDLGDNLWLFRLRRSGFCPTTHGPRRPSMTWMGGPEVNRRFGRRGRQPGDLLPLLDVDASLDSRSVRTLADRVGVRLDLSPSSFESEDARGVVQRLSDLYGPGARRLDADALRRVIKPTYRELFELLSGARVDDAPLDDAPMLAHTAGGYRFFPAHEMLYARSPGIKQRSGVGDRVPIFVLEAEPAAGAPLSNVFGMKALEDALEWEPFPGDPGLDDDELSEFRSQLRELAHVLLARLRVERASSAADDRTRLLEFVENVEPVTALEVACSMGGETVTSRAERTYFVEPAARGRPLQAFLVWEGIPWPPAPDVQQTLAMAIADALGVNLVETFLAFIDGDDDRRRRLLDLAGAAAHLDEIHLELRIGEEPTELSSDDDTLAIDKSAAPEAGSRNEAPAGTTPPTSPAAAGKMKLPLVSFRDLDLAGEIELVVGSDGGQGRRPRGVAGSGGRPPQGDAPSGPRHAAAETDTSELDRLGMRIAMAYELRRLRRQGSPAAILGQEQSDAAASLVMDVSTPAVITYAIERSTIARLAFEWLRQRGVGELYPGFDILTVSDGRVERMIELKSSGVDARVQTMSWNEWKSARADDLRSRFWLYLVGNLRADIPAPPFVRAIRDPFGSLMSEEVSETATRRAVQLLVRQFEEAEQLVLGPRTAGD